MTKQQTVIQLQNINYSYGNYPVLKNINMEVNKGDFIGIVGPNAGGKSTLVKLILGLLKPQSGIVKVLGKNASSISHKIGYVPQHPTFLRDFPITVEQAVLMGRIGSNLLYKKYNALYPGSYNKTDKELVNKALIKVEADNLSNNQISSLSGGQLQKVLLARALISNPSILLLDEPTANIDQRMEGDIFDLLKELNSKITILVVSHDIAFISAYVHTVACVNRTLVCHKTNTIDGNIIQNLYGSNVRMVEHTH